jgi:tetratricopeptide (TPR) repeat protein
VRARWQVPGAGLKRTWRRAAGAVLAGLLCVLVPGEAAVRDPGRGFVGLPGLRAAYDLILDAQFDQAEAALARACGPAPAEACLVLEATRLWWRILQDPRDRSFDVPFLRAVEQAIAGAEAWVAHEPERAEAWFYLGAAYGARVSWRVERGERLAAARDGKRIKESLERALELDPGFEDARFGIGLYKYYAATAPAVARFFRFLLLLPGGDKVEGLRDMQASEARGHLVSGEALYQLHWIYLWYEEQPRRGRAVLVRLHERYPSNPHFLHRRAEVEREYFQDRGQSLAAWRRMIARAPHGEVARLAEMRGRVGAAEDLDALFETDRAVTEIRRALALETDTPVGAIARASLLLGRFSDRLGSRDEAVAAYRAAIAAVPPGDPDRVRAAAAAGMRRGPPPGPGDAYRVSLEGWRAFERGDGATARRLLTRARSLAAGDAMIRARWARAIAAVDPDAALAELESLIAARPRVNGVALSAAFLWSADLLRQKGESAAARDRYDAAASVFAGDSRLGAAARRAMASLK